MRPPPDCFYEKGTLREHSGPQPVTAQGKRLQLLQGEQTEKPNSWERRYDLSCSANKPSNKNTTTDKYLTIIKYLLCQAMLTLQDFFSENQDGGVGRHTAPPRTTRTDRESNSKGDQHQGNRK